MKLNNAAHYVATRIIRKIQSWIGFITLGPRAIILNEHNQVLLVKHTYQPGWYLPGGGLKGGESARDALIREVWEEVGFIVAKDEPLLFGMYHHIYLGVNDYPIIYIIKNFSKAENHSSSPEIESAEWFSYEQLPDSVSPGTKRRLTEYFAKQAPADKW